MVVPSSECIIWLTVFIAESVAIVTVNLLAILLFIKNRSLCTRSMYLVISLTVADMLVGVLCGSYVPFVLLLIHGLIKLNLSPKVLNSFTSFDLFLPLTSLTHIVVISLERFHATFRPFRHRIIKRWVYVVAIVVVWVFPLIVSIIWAVESLFYLFSYHFYIIESYCLLCLIATFVSYTSILFKFRFGAHPQRHCAALLRQRKLTVTLFITTLVSLLSWLPYNIFLILHWSTDNFHSLSLLRLAYALQFLFYANSLVNPILYTTRMPDFKKALLSLFRRHQRENVAIPLNRY